jgi:hypothetical protein
MLQKDAKKRALMLRNTPKSAHFYQLFTRFSHPICVFRLTHPAQTAHFHPRNTQYDLIIYAKQTQFAGYPATKKCKTNPISTGERRETRDERRINMQNSSFVVVLRRTDKPNLPNGQMNLNTVITRDYESKHLRGREKNKPNFNKGLT